MPICPGCEQSVPYDRLDLHERYCHGIWGERTNAAVAFERLDRRLERIESDLDRGLSRGDRARRTLRRT